MGGEEGNGRAEAGCGLRVPAGACGAPAAASALPKVKNRLWQLGLAVLPLSARGEPCGSLGSPREQPAPWGRGPVLAHGKPGLAAAGRPEGKQGPHKPPQGRCLTPRPVSRRR